MIPNKITLIGMPAAGKTTVGEALATHLGYDFMDLDSMVEEKEGTDLIEVMNTKGPEYFRQMEYEFVKDLPEDKKVVISPAGSIIFQANAMEWLKRNTKVIFLQRTFEYIEKGNRDQKKAVAGLAERGIKSIWDERLPIYNKFADLVIDGQDFDTDIVVDDIVAQLTA